jgi:hypothetical protein
MTRVLDAGWLDWIPADSTAAVLSLAVDPRPKAWDQLFQFADRIEQLDPARAGVVAPLRSRLTLVSLAAKVNLEADLWPVLRGVTAALLVDRQGNVSGGLCLLHVDDARAAQRLESAVIPRLAAAWVKQAGSAKASRELRALGQLAGRPLQSASRGTTVLVGWGESALASALDAKANPARSAGGLIRQHWTSAAPQRAGAIWPGRLRLPGPETSSWSVALAGSAPIVWHGTIGRTSTRDEFQWGELRGLVERFIDGIPFVPPPE